MDNLDKIQKQWAEQSPELDTQAMALIGRMFLVCHDVSTQMQKTFIQFGLKQPSFDVMASLLRSGEPYALTPNDLLEQMLITSGAMTSRINGLEKRGWIKRIPSKEDKRSFLVALTESGKKLIEAALLKHVETQNALVGRFTNKQQSQLDKAFKDYLSQVNDITKNSKEKTKL